MTLHLRQNTGKAASKRQEDEGMKGGDVVLNDTDYLWRDDEEERVTIQR